MHAAEDARKPLVLFIVITFGLSTIFWVSMIRAGTYLVNSSLDLVLLLWCPSIAALASAYHYREGAGLFGLRLGRVRYVVAGYLIPIVYAAVSVGIIIFWGLGSYSGHVSYGPFSNATDFIVAGTTLTFITAIGEEIGWRGFLVPHLAKRWNFTLVALLSGLIWAIWHYPLFLIPDYNAMGPPLWYAIPVFTVLVIGISFALAWLRLKSGSVWPAIFFHASWNLWLLFFFVPLVGLKDVTRYFVGETGAVTAIVVLIGALVFWRLRGMLPSE